MARPPPLLLVVDDDNALGQMLAWDLEELGYRVHKVGDVRSALEGLETLRPDLVLLDYRLPDGNGLDILERLNRFTPTPPAIVISGESEPGLPQRCRQQGAREFLRKPLQVTSLDQLIRGLLLA